MNVRALVLLCSVSPRGSTGTVMRYLLQKPKLAWDIVRAFVLKDAATDLAICRRVFFSETAPSDSEVREYMEYFAADSVVGLDTRSAPQHFPGKTSAGADGRCSFRDRLPPTLVVGADADLVVDNKAVEETAEFYDAKLLWVRGPHDIMLDPAGLSLDLFIYLSASISFCSPGLLRHYCDDSTKLWGIGLSHTLGRCLVLP